MQLPMCVFAEDTDDLMVGLSDLRIDDTIPPLHYTLCASIEKVEERTTVVLQCQPTIVSGRFLFIRTTSAADTELTLSEVQVYTGRQGFIDNGSKTRMHDYCSTG